jgi:DNA-binding beta-propeller fold protein YncE
MRSTMGGDRRRGWLRRWWLGAALAACLVWAATAQAQPFVYVANENAQPFSPGNVAQFDAVGGALSPLAPATVPAGAAPLGIAASPDGKSVYVANGLDNTVSQYDVGAGGLTPKTPATVAAPSPVGVAVSPDGKSVYVTNGIFCNGTVSQFDVGAGGVLTPKSPATVAAGCHPTSVAVSPDGNSVYVTNSVFASNEVLASISQYDVAPGGTLSAKTPGSVVTPSNPMGIVVSPDGRSVYVPDFGDSTGGPGVLEYDSGAGGVLVAKSPAIVPAGAQPEGVAVSPDGKSVYVTNHCTPDLSDLGSVSQYDVGVSGVLTAKTPPTVASGACPSGVAVSPDGKSAYVGALLPGPVGVMFQYDIGQGGVLTAKTPATVATGGFPNGVAVTPLPPVPTSKDQCKDGGWRNFPQFKNQGDCVSHVATNGNNQAG